MFEFLNRDAGHLDPKIYTTIGALPAQIDDAHPPTRKKKPWKTINDHNFVRSLELIWPEEMHEIIWQQVNERMKRIKYAKVIMKLEQVLEGSFFNEYVKKGNILMLSEGRPGVDNLFSLQDGILKMDLDKESYERAGLQGNPIRSGGRKHVDARYRVEINLRLPSMLHGKKGFERIVRAAKAVLNMSLVWLFANISIASEDNVAAGSDTPRSPVDQHHPVHVEQTPTINEVINIIVPPLVPPSSDGHTTLSDWIYETTEWLGLVGLDSPRIKEGDAPDPYLSRYSVPGGSHDTGIKIRKVSWTGMINGGFIMQLLIEIIRLSRLESSPSSSPLSTWMAVTARLHNTDAVGQENGYNIILSAQGPGPTGLSVKEGNDTTEHEVSALSTGVTNTPSGGGSVSVASNDGPATGLHFYAFLEFVDNVNG